jgi:hypothetical protein
MPQRAKPAWRSKTNLVAMLMILADVFQRVAGLDVLEATPIADHGMAAAGAVMILLRAVTTQPVTLKPGGDHGTR